MAAAPPEPLDRRTPKEVKPTAEAREPTWDPRVGADEVPVDRSTTPRHRLVTIGDSLTHGFQSCAIFNTALSYPAIVAHELGTGAAFRFPDYPGFGGLPLNLEYVLRELEHEFGPRVNPFELPLALFRLRQLSAHIEDYWERGPGREPPRRTGINNNLGVYGWDLRDALDRTAEVCRRLIDEPTDGTFSQLVEDANERAALRVLPTTGAQDRSVFDCARHLEADGGIETLVVMLGANNALGAVTELAVHWSGDGFDDLDGKRKFTVWAPSHFKRELDEVATAVEGVGARHVIWGTVPHVTIAPLARGTQGKLHPESRYFPFYTRPWISDADFEPTRDPCITASEARDVDRAVDQYNDSIADTVKGARANGLDWYLLDVAGLLDRLAHRRYLVSPRARPTWWRPYSLPAELATLDPPPNSCFLAVDGRGRRRNGGLFSLDGIHPTTVGYGILAQEVIDVMQLAGVPFFRPDGTTPRTGPVRVDFRRLVQRDTLLRDPPRLVGQTLEVVGFVDEVLDVFGRLLRVGEVPSEN